MDPQLASTGGSSADGRRSSATISRHQSTVADALSGDPSRAALASGISGIVQALMLLPINTIQTQMQTSGRSMIATIKTNFAAGFGAGVRSLYRAIGPTVGMLGVRQGIKFGSATAVKHKLPLHWPELLRDVVAGATSAVTSTTLVFPLDTLKTRLQNNLGLPSTLSGFYSGYAPAAAYSAFGMGLWVSTRNTFERRLPYDGPGKHLICGAVAGIFVQLPTFPLDTLKKRMQSADSGSGGARASVLAEARSLLAEGGPQRFYRGFSVKCGFVALNGAIFNSVYVAVRKALRLASDERATHSLGPVDAMTRAAPTAKQ